MNKLTKIYVVEANFRRKEETGVGLFFNTSILVDHWNRVGMFLTKKEADGVIMTRSFMFGDDPSLAGTRIIEREADEKDIIYKGNKIDTIWGKSLGS